MFENDVSGGLNRDSLHSSQVSLIHSGISLKMVSSVVQVWI